MTISVLKWIFRVGWVQQLMSWRASCQFYVMIARYPLIPAMIDGLMMNADDQNRVLRPAVVVSSDPLCRRKKVLIDEQDRNPECFDDV